MFRIVHCFYLTSHYTLTILSLILLDLATKPSINSEEMTAQVKAGVTEMLSAGDEKALTLALEKRALASTALSRYGPQTVGDWGGSLNRKKAPSLQPMLYETQHTHSRAHP